MKKILSMIAVFSALMISCNKVDVYEDTTNPLPLPAQTDQPVQGMDITPKNNYVVVGDVVNLTVSFSPETAAAGTVTWTSSDEAVATVDANGQVSTLSVGVARITASVEGASVTAIVNVFAERVAATEIKLNKSEVNLLVGRATKVKATLLPDGTGEDGVVTTDQPAFEWTSSDENVAIVSYGFIQAVGMGEATITASQNGLTASCKVIVADKITLQDRSEVWPITDTPKWDKNWSGQVTGSHEEVTVSSVDAERFYFAVVAADKFEGIEAVANTLYEQVEERKDAGQDPSGLFRTGETATVNYSDLGPAVAYALGYDEECEFTGEYSLYEFEAVTPDPVHATGIQFTQSWNNTPISEIILKEGKSLNYFSAKLLPDDCTDTGTITFSSTDQSVVTLRLYYSNYYTVTAVSAGEADIVAKFNDLEETIHVTVTGGDIVWTDKSKEWKGTFQMGKLYDYYDVFGFNLESCTSSEHFIAVVNASNISGDPYAYYKTVAGQNESSLGWYASSDLPDFSGSWGDTDETIERYAYVFGVVSGDYDGNYAIFHYDPSNPGGGDEPGPDPVEGKIIKFSNTIFRAELPSSRATSDEGTLEAWINVSSTSGCQNIIGAEANFLLRIDGGQLDYVYGGTIDSRGEVGEEHVRTSITTGEWHHVAATYTQNGQAVLYVDGRQVGSGNTQDHPVYMDGKLKNDGSYPCWGLPFRFYIGSGNDKHHFEGGSIAYARVWDVALSADEVSSYMNKEDVSSGNLLGYWKFNEGSGNTITDYSGNGITLTAKTSDGATATANLSDKDVEWIDGTLPY